MATLKMMSEMRGVNAFEFDMMQAPWSSILKTGS